MPGPAGAGRAGVAPTRGSGVVADRKRQADGRLGPQLRVERRPLDGHLLLGPAPSLVRLRRVLRRRGLTRDRRLSRPRPGADRPHEQHDHDRERDEPRCSGDRQLHEQRAPGMGQLLADRLAVEARRPGAEEPVQRVPPQRLDRLDVTSGNAGDDDHLVEAEVDRAPHDARHPVDDGRERARWGVDRHLGHHSVEAVSATDGDGDAGEPGVTQGALGAVDSGQLTAAGRRRRERQRGYQEEQPLHTKTTRSSRWTTSVGEPSGRSDVRRPADWRMTAAPQRTRPLANTFPDASAISTASSASKLPCTSRTPAARSDAPLSVRARRAPSSTTTVPAAPTANAIQSLRAGRRRSCSRTTVPTLGSPAIASASTPGRSAAAITARTPDQAAISTAASFEALPPLPRDVPRPPARRSSSWSTSRISSIREASLLSLGSAVSIPGVSVSRTS